MNVIICNYFIFLLNLGHAILIPGVAFLFAWGSEQRYSNQECLQYGMFLSKFLEQVQAVGMPRLNQESLWPVPPGRSARLTSRPAPLSKPLARA
jgi:hypothetical protein